jgi:hypothetical protein
MITKRIYLANVSIENGSKPEAQLFVNIAAIDEKGHVQLAPYGDFLNIDAKGHRIIQRFQKSDAETIVNEFNSLMNTPQRLLGAPWYIGHPDHSRFKGIHIDTRAYGRIKKLEAGEDGLYANVRFGSAGKQLLDDEAFHGHSVNWGAIPNGHENGYRIFRPVSLKSVGFTNEPQIPVLPASLANADSAQGFDQPLPGYAVGANPEDNDDMTIPPKLKILAGFKADEDVTIEQVIAALETKNQKYTSMSNTKIKIGDDEFEVIFANDASAALPERITKIIGESDKNQKAAAKASEDLANAETARKAERKARATIVIDQLVKAGKIVTKDRDARIEDLCNAEDFDAKAKEFANAGVTVKTSAASGKLAGKHAELTNDVATRQQKFNALMNERAQQFPNESYDDRFNAVSRSEVGQQLFTQMQRPSNGQE